MHRIILNWYQFKTCTGFSRSSHRPFWIYFCIFILGKIFLSLKYKNTCGLEFILYENKNSYLFSIANRNKAISILMYVYKSQCIVWKTVNWAEPLIRPDKGLWVIT